MPRITMGGTNVFVLAGTVLTALGYTLGGANWMVVVLAAFLTTFLCYLPSAYSPHGATGVCRSTSGS